MTTDNSGIDIQDLLYLLGQKQQAAQSQKLDPNAILQQYNAIRASGHKTAAADAGKFLTDITKVNTLLDKQAANIAVPKELGGAAPEAPAAKTQAIRQTYNDPTYNSIFDDVDNGMSLPDLLGHISTDPAFNDDPLKVKAVSDAVTKYASARQEDSTAQTAFQKTLADHQSTQDAAAQDLLVNHPDIGQQLKQRGAARQGAADLTNRLIEKHTTHPIAGFVPTPQSAASQGSTAQNALAAYVKSRMTEEMKKRGL